jgi:hypothetical protein
MSAAARLPDVQQTEWIAASQTTQRNSIKRNRSLMLIAPFAVKSSSPGCEAHTLPAHEDVR